jgi:hypothetical protein
LISQNRVRVRVSDFTVDEVVDIQDYSSDSAITSGTDSEPDDEEPDMESDHSLSTSGSDSRAILYG